MDQVARQLARLREHGDIQLLKDSLIGLEKESLRVASGGGMAMTPHPRVLGSALTHPWLTTDYSEALTEFITPPASGAFQALDFLADLQSYVYARLDRELLWATSMPCILAGEDSVPVAQYGNSNAGRMKTLYRVGLGHRYGRVMQVIAGVHFNWSLSDTFWSMYQRVAGDAGSAREFRDRGYMGLVRNLQRIGWLIPYLFGASPAVCQSFFVGRKSSLPRFDDATYFRPFGTSLRMGDIGYQNSREEGLGIKACYDDVQCYADSLLRATQAPAAVWEALGVKVDGEYRQLNANILQIENEYYSSVRPKQVLEWMEKPSLALKRRGIRYIELRSLDVNAYHPLGIDETQARFIEAFLLYGLLTESPPIGCRERGEIDRNLEQVANQGRDPGFRLLRDGEQLPLRDVALGILESMWPICELLDQFEGENLYQDALEDQLAKANEPSLTPSARMLREMRDNGESFYQFARRLSNMHHRYFLERRLPPQREAELERLAVQSLADQERLEAGDQVDFDQFLNDYFAQA